jgi:CheY-like chemotaxis protein
MQTSPAHMAASSMPLQILVVEDEPIIRFAIAEALRELGVCVIEAATADEAWDYVTSGAHLDLVFTDHRMPGSMTGAVLAERLRARDPALKIVVTTTHIDPREWAEPILAKPYGITQTAAKLVARALGEA